MIAYVTQFALSRGILTVEGHLEEQLQLIPGLAIDKNATRFIWTDDQGIKHVYLKESSSWHRTLESAQKKAEEMRREKISELKDRIAHLESISFQ